MARPISLHPATNPTLRHATRLLSMIHELHKAGYQRVRFSSGMSPSGMHWRCAVTHAENMTTDGLHIRDYDAAGEVAKYTSGSGSKYFGWTDVDGYSARHLADTFIRRYPIIARRGDVRDWRYAGWLTDVLGRAELGGGGALPVFFADYEVELDPDWSPPHIDGGSSG